jgi:hypothetical protein
MPMHLIIVGVLAVALVAALVLASVQRRRSKPEPAASKPRDRIKLRRARRSQKPIEAIEVNPPRAAEQTAPELAAAEPTVGGATAEGSTAEGSTVEESQQPKTSGFWTLKVRKPRAKKVKEPKAEKVKEPKASKELKASKGRSRLSLRRRPKDPFEEAAVAAISDEPLIPPVPPMDGSQTAGAVLPPPPPAVELGPGDDATLEPPEPVGADLTLELQAVADSAGEHEPPVPPDGSQATEGGAPPHEQNVPALHAVDKPAGRARRTVCSYCWHPNLGDLDVCEKCGGQLRLIAI